jgi:hypothetical protein
MNDRNDENETQARESMFLKDTLGDRMSIKDFFKDVWQQRAVVFPFSGERPTCHKYDGTWNDEQMQVSILKELVHQGWSILTEILQQSEKLQSRIESDKNAEEHECPLLFRNLELQSREDIEDLYGASVFGPYLNGCSIVLNHGDLISPWIAAVCNDIQESFPHAYANCYLTPPNSQAVPAHADDRDVLVVQLVGSKNWQVYQSMPVPYPYPHEQVGKDGIPVPPQVLEGPLSVSTTLQPGDVLYMPRGFVHQAQCSDSLSFHMTIALATHDWTLAGTMTMATKSILSSVVEYRKSILPTRDMEPSQLQAQIDEAFARVKSEVTAESILGNLSAKLENHNGRAFPLRMKLIHRARFPPEGHGHEKAPDCVGALAAEKVTLETIIRAATKEERARIETGSTRPRGLNVREEIADSIIGIISALKANASTQRRVKDFASLVPSPNPMVCDLALLSLAKRSVELGALAVVDR